MSKEILRIATRESPLAMWQAEYVQQALRDRYPDFTGRTVTHDNQR